MDFNPELPSNVLTVTTPTSLNSNSNNRGHSIDYSDPPLLQDCYSPDPDYFTPRLSKVSEDHSHHNSDNSNNSLDPQTKTNKNNSQTMYNHNNNNNNNNHNHMHNQQTLTHSSMYYQQNNHNPGNHGHTNTPYDDMSPDQSSLFLEDHRTHEFLPERLRLLLDRFAANGYIVSNAPPAANKAVIDNLPEMFVDKHIIETYDSNQDGIIECAICQCPMEMQCKIKKLPCKHIYHSKCIITWLHIHASCPLCRRCLTDNNTLNNNNNNNQIGVSEAMRTEDASSRAMMNRLHDLRNRRRTQNRLRSPPTPRNRRIQNNNNNSNNNSPNNNSSSTHNDAMATQLIHAVCEILDQYKTTQNQLNNQDGDARTVRFKVNSPRPQPPRSSRKTTQTRNSLPNLSAISVSESLPFSDPTIARLNYSSPNHVYRDNTNANNNNNNNGNNGNGSVNGNNSSVNNSNRRLDDGVNINNSMTFDGDVYLDELVSDDDVNDNINNISIQPRISAKSIKQDLAHFRKRSSLSTRRKKTKSVDTTNVNMNMNVNANDDDMKSQVVHPKSAKSKTIIYNSNYNQNYIYNNNYNNRGQSDTIYDSDDATLMALPHSLKKNESNLSVLPNNITLSSTTASQTSDQTMIERQSVNFTPITYSGQSSPVLCSISGGGGNSSRNINCNMSGGYDSISNFNLSLSLQSTPTPQLQKINPAIWSVMSNEQLDTAINRHRKIASDQQRIIAQIQKEKKQRIIYNQNESQWNCPKCMKRCRSFIFLPCRHLGLCNDCSTNKASLTCFVCNNKVKQKVPINFSEL